MEARTTRRRDFILGLVVLSLSLLVLFWLMPFAVKTPQTVPVLALSPVFWPRIIVIGLAGLGLLLMFGAMRGTASQSPSEMYDRAPFDRSDFRVVAAICIMVGFAFLLERFGIVIPAMLLLFALVVLHDRRRLIGALGLSVLLVCGLYFFFRYVAGVAVPLGPLAGLI